MPCLGSGAIHPVPELLPGFERWYATGFDLDRCPGLRIAPCARGRVADGKCAEATQVDTLAFSQAFRYGLDECVDGDLHLLPRQILLLSDDVDQISLLHELGSLLVDVS